MATAAHADVTRRDFLYIATGAVGAVGTALKHFDHMDVAPAPDGSAAVYVYGTLYGELNDGSTYEGVRYVDRFSVRDGKFTDMMVWNDMAAVLGDRLKARPA